MERSARRELAATFDADAEGYDRARPGYPPELFTDLVALTGRCAGDSVVEVGSGTGKATVPLVEFGFRVVGVEPGRALAAVARRKFAGGAAVGFVESTFERWQPVGRYDMVFAATSWHWVDPAVRYVKAAEVLRPGGVLAVVTTHHVAPVGAGDPFFLAVQPVYESIGELTGAAPPLPGLVADLAGEMAEGGLFSEAASCRICGSRVMPSMSISTCSTAIPAIGSWGGMCGRTCSTRFASWSLIGLMVGSVSIICLC